MLNLDVLERWANEAEARNQALGLTASLDTLSLKLARRVRGERAAVAPGLLGRVVQSGDGTWDYPTVVLVSIADTRRWLARQRAKEAP